MKAILVLKEGVKLVYFGAKVYYRVRHGKNKFALGKIISKETKIFKDMSNIASKFKGIKKNIS